MSATAPLPNAPPSVVPPASPVDPAVPPITLAPLSRPNAGAPPPEIPTVPPPDTQLPPPAVITVPPPAIPPSATQLPPPLVMAPPPLKPASSPPPPPSEVVSPSPPKEVVSPPPPSEVASPPLPNAVVSPPPPSEVGSPPPPSSPPPPMPPSDPHEIRPPSPPLPALEPPSSSSPPTSSPTPPSPDPPPPPNSEQPQTSPPPPRKSPPTTTHRPPTPPPERPSASPSPPPFTKSPPSPSLTPPSPPLPSPTNTSTYLSPPTVIQLAPPSVISSPFPNSNPYALETSNSNSTRNSSTNAAVAAGVGLSLGAIALGLIILIIWCILQKKKESLKGHCIVPSPFRSSPKGDCTLKVNSSAPLLQSVFASDSAYSSREPGGLGHTRSWFAYEELVVATNGFSPKNVLGEGGFGFVYKGFLPDGRVIAVKQLKIGGGQGEREFKAEVELISRIHHRHLVSLVGYCVADSKRLLVYEYVPNESLYFHLHGEGRPPMIWATRVRVAAGAARGIAYLHEDCHPRIIHRDIKSSNILLDNHFDARVSDFGLAKLALDSYSHVTTRVMGTFGYMAPEYASSGKLTEKSDVYSFGVVLLELITGRKPVDASQPSGDESLVEWARPLLGQAIETAEFGPLVDPRLEKNYVDAEMFRLIEAAAACVRHSANNRPRMGQVVRFFDSLLASDITNGMPMGQSQVYDSVEHSTEIRLFRKMAFGSQNYNSDFFSDESQLYENTRRQENGSSFSDLHNETTHVLEVDLESDNKTTELISHLHS